MDPILEDESHAGSLPPGSSPALSTLDFGPGQASGGGAQKARTTTPVATSNFGGPSGWDVSMSVDEYSVVDQPASRPRRILFPHIKGKAMKSLGGSEEVMIRHEVRWSCGTPEHVMVGNAAWSLHAALTMQRPCSGAVHARPGTCDAVTSVRAWTNEKELDPATCTSTQGPVPAQLRCALTSRSTHGGGAPRSSPQHAR